MFWILTPDPNRGFGITYTTARDEAVFREIQRAAQNFSALRSADPPERLLNSNRHLIPRQLPGRVQDDPDTSPRMIVREDRSILYGFKPQLATQARFEKLAVGAGYLWGFGMGFVEYVVPARADRRTVSQIIVRAHIQPVLPIDGRAGRHQDASYAFC